jgi:hypothetical protein
MAITFWIVIADGTRLRYDYDYEVEVSAADLRDRFNTGYYWYRAEIEGEFAFAYEYNELAPPEANQPVGTLSQEIIYYATIDGENDFVARIHQYLLPDDERDEAGQLKLGGSGMPDPKELLEDRVFRVARRRRRPRF